MLKQICFAIALMLAASNAGAYLPHVPFIRRTASVTAPPSLRKARPAIDNNLDDPTAIHVVGRRRPHRMMRFFFGRHRRPGGFFTNLVHPLHWKETLGRRKHCARPSHTQSTSHRRIRRRCVL